jgi:hypothetical protein
MLTLMYLARLVYRIVHLYDGHECPVHQLHVFMSDRELSSRRLRVATTDTIEVSTHF